MRANLQAVRDILQANQPPKYQQYNPLAYATRLRRANLEWSLGSNRSARRKTASGGPSRKLGGWLRSDLKQKWVPHLVFEM